MLKRTILGGCAIGMLWLAFGPAVAQAQEAETIWVEDGIPSGWEDGPARGNWEWVSDNPKPFSGKACLRTEIFSLKGDLWRGIRSKGPQLPLDPGDTIFVYVYLDPENIPHEVMLSFVINSNGDHRAYWGANNLAQIEEEYSMPASPLGTDGTASRRHVGPLPEAGKWVRLEVPAAAVGLENKTLSGMAFTLFGGRATWDYAGKVSAAGK